MRELFKTELELTDTDVLRIPGIFEDVGSCPYSNAPLETAALIPGMLNLIVSNFAGEAPHIFVSDPFMRANVDSQAGDPLIAAFDAAMPAGYTVHHVDDWYTYHVNTGEVHCGTNVTRTPTAEWWMVGLGLLGVL
jgi:protein-arginine deiminase